MAALWTWFAARSAQVRLPWAYSTSLFLAAWVLYAGDRLLDGRRPASGVIGADLEERHRFHSRHRRRFLIALVGAMIGLICCLPRLDNRTLVMYSLLSIALAAWLVRVHVRPSVRSPPRLPKELVVGPFFAAASFAPALLHAPGRTWQVLSGALLFAAVCSLNCLLLYAWEHPARQEEAHVSTRWCLQRPKLLCLIVIALGIGLGQVESLHHGIPFLRSPMALLPFACALAASLLLWLHAWHEHIELLTLRVAGDAALLTPLLFLPFLR